MPSRVTIRCLAAYTADAEEAGGGLVPLFVGRDDGTVERYDAMQDAELGIPTLSFFAHRRAVTGIVAISPQELYTCSLDGTVKQWTLEDAEDAAASAVGAAGARTRAALVKTSTFPFAVRTMIQEGTGAAAGQQRLFLGGEDGSLTLMEGERRSSWPAHDGGALTSIAVDTNGTGCVLTGGTDGLIYVWDMESGRPVCELRGHTGAIAALSVVAVPASIPVVRAKREMTGDAEAAPSAASAVKDVLVFADAEDDGGGAGAATCLVSCAQDSTLKVWLLPELREAAAEADLMEQQQQLQQQLRKASDESTPGQRRSVGISFQEPNEDDSSTKAAAAGVEDSADAVVAAGDDANADADALNGADADSGSPTQTEYSTHSPVYDAKLHFLQQQTSATAWKSALKAPERRTVPAHAALGTVELPHTPYTCSSPSAGGDGDEMDGGNGAAAALLYIGAAQGHVYGLKDRLLVKEVCKHTAYNFQKVQQEVRSVQRTLKDGVKVYTKAAAAAMKAAEAKELKIAAQARKAKLAQEAAAKKKEAEERRAARRAAAAAAAAERSDDDEEGEEEEDGEYFDDEEELDGEGREEEDEEDGEEEEEEAEEEADGEGGEAEAGEDGQAADGALEGVANDAFSPMGVAAAARSTPRRPASWKKLTDEQRASLETLFTAQEKERDERVAALQKAVEAHLAQLQPLAKTPYHRSRGQFANLPYTTSGCVRGGPAVVALVSAARVPKYDKVYLAQGNTVAALSVQLGVTKL